MRIGVDVGGTKIEAALVDIHGKIHKNVRILTEAFKGKKVVLENIVKVIKEIDDGRSAIGIGLPGIVGNNGKLVRIRNIPCLNGVNVAEYLEKIFSRNVEQDNDANCFAMAEVRFGASKGSKSSIGIIIGTGIGSGLILNTKLVRGRDGSGGAIGHMQFDGKEFEAWCAGPGIEKRYGHGKNDQEIFNSDDLRAIKVVDETYSVLAGQIANLVFAFNPDIIVFGGGVSNSLDYKRLRKEVDKLLIPTIGVELVKNELGDGSGVIGAAFL